MLPKFLHFRVNSLQFDRPPSNVQTNSIDLKNELTTSLNFKSEQKLISTAEVVYEYSHADSSAPDANKTVLLRAEFCAYFEQPEHIPGGSDADQASTYIAAFAAAMAQTELKRLLQVFGIKTPVPLVEHLEMVRHGEQIPVLPSVQDVNS